jgi:hypothetical protein
MTNMTESIGPFYDVLKKIEEARQELEKGLPKSDRDAANAIFKAMCDANLRYMDMPKTIHHLAMAPLLYSQAVLRQHMSAQATKGIMVAT